MVIKHDCVTTFMLASWRHDIDHAIDLVEHAVTSFLLSPIVVYRVSVTSFMFASWRHNIDHAIDLVEHAVTSFLLSPIVV